MSGSAFPPGSLWTVRPWLPGPRGVGAAIDWWVDLPCVSHPPWLLVVPVSASWPPRMGLVPSAGSGPPPLAPGGTRSRRAPVGTGGASVSPAPPLAIADSERLDPRRRWIQVPCDHIFARAPAMRHRDSGRGRWSFFVPSCSRLARASTFFAWMPRTSRGMTMEERGSRPSGLRGASSLPASCRWARRWAAAPCHRAHHRGSGTTRRGVRASARSRSVRAGS